MRRDEPEGQVRAEAGMRVGSQAAAVSVRRRKRGRMSGISDHMSTSGNWQTILQQKVCVSEGENTRGRGRWGGGEYTIPSRFDNQSSLVTNVLEQNFDQLYQLYLDKYRSLNSTN